MDPLIHVLLALTAVVALGWVLGRLFAYVHQPAVIGEIVAGIVLGPSVLGRCWPEAMEFVLPASAAPHLGVIAQLGVIFYMFLIGLELNLDALHGRAGTIGIISFTGIAVPFALGAGLAWFLYARLSSSDVSFLSFTLFLGVAMAITAFPVLARILAEQRLTKTPLGVVALACAAVDDATAWCLLALVVGIVKTQGDGAFLVIGLTIAYALLMLMVVRPLAGRWLPAVGTSRGTSALVFVALLASALATEFIGIHAIFGAFLLGAIIPHDSPVAREFTHKLEDVVTVLLLPAFFAFTGLRTQIGLVASVEEWLVCGLIIVVATLGKFGGILLAARSTGMSWRESSALGVLMNTRGLMELIVLNIGLDLGVISPALFAMMVLMALVTTMATTPILRLMGTQSPDGISHGDSIGGKSRVEANQE